MSSTRSPRRATSPGDRLTYNATYGLNDPNAILFVLEEDLAALRSGARPPEPLVLRAAAGECVEVTLVNDLPEDPPKSPHWNYNAPIVDGFNVNQVKPSNRVSLHPQLVAYDVTASDGANVGQNPDQTVERGKQRTYTWYAGDISVTARGDVRWQPIELGAVNLKDMADVVNHPMHGGIGALIVEPEGAVWYPSRDSRAAAQVKHRDENGSEIWFREFVLLYQDEVPLQVGSGGFPLPQPGPGLRRHPRERLWPSRSGLHWPQGVQLPRRAHLGAARRGAGRASRVPSRPRRQRRLQLGGARRSGDADLHGGAL